MPLRPAARGLTNRKPNYYENFTPQGLGRRLLWSQREQTAVAGPSNLAGGLPDWTNPTTQNLLSTYPHCGGIHCCQWATVGQLPAAHFGRGSRQFAGFLSRLPARPSSCWAISFASSQMLINRLLGLARQLFQLLTGGLLRDYSQRG